MLPINPVLFNERLQFGRVAELRFFALLHYVVAQFGREIFCLFPILYASHPGTLEGGVAG